MAIEKFAVEIDANASSLKKETDASKQKLQELQEELKEVKRSIAEAFQASKGRDTGLAQMLSDAEHLRRKLKDAMSSGSSIDNTYIDKLTKELDKLRGNNSDVVDPGNIDQAADSVADMGNNLAEALLNFKETRDVAAELREQLDKAHNKGISEAQNDMYALYQQISNIIYKLEELNTKESLSMVPKASNFQAAIYSQLDDIYKAKAELAAVAHKIKDIKKEWLSTFKGKGAFRDIKRIGLAILGIRSIFAGIRKAMTSYLSQNEELQSKLNSIWYALGSMLAPILEWIVRVFSKLIAYVNVFVRALGFAGMDLSNMNKAANKLKKTISGFDELNIYSKDSEQANANPFENIELNDSWVNALTVLGATLKPLIEWLKNAVKWIFDFIEEHGGIVVGIISAILGIKLIKWIADIGNSLKSLWLTFKIFGGATTIFNGIKAALSGVVDLIGNIIFAIAQSPLTPIIAGIVAVVGGAILAVKEFFDMWSNGWSLLKSILEAIGLAIAAVGAIILGAPAVVAGVIAGIVFAVSQFAIVIHEHWDEVVAWTKEMWEKIKAVWNTFVNGTKEVFTAIGAWLSEKWTSIKNVLSTVWENIKQVGIDVWNALKQATISIFTTLGEGIKSIWNTLKNFLSNIWNSISNIAVNAWNGLSSFVTGIVSKLTSAVSNMFSNMGEKIKSIWEGIKEFIKAPINGILGYVNKLMSGVASGLNGMIRSLNKLSWSTPDWIPYIGGKSFGFNLREISIPQIPMLANGGVITSPTLAMMGEYAGARSNPEIAAPQSLFREMMSENNVELVNAFSQMTRQVIAAIGDVDMEVSIGDDVIARSASRGNKSYYKMTGKELISI